MQSSATPALRAARRSLQEVNEIADVSEWKYASRLGRWTVMFNVHLPGVGDFSEKTGWHFVVSPDYPYGTIQVFPDAKAGIIDTYPHQRGNTHRDTSRPWRDGEICVTNQFQHFGRYALTDEPWTSYERLLWYARRTVGWVRAASSGELTLDNDFYEQPAFDASGETNWHFAFQEDAITFELWSRSPAVIGTVDMIQSSSSGETILISRFRDLRGRTIITAPWRPRHSDQPVRRLKGVWIRIPGPPVIPPFAAPATLAELADVTNEYELDLWHALEPLCRKVRDQTEFILLIGYPVKRLNRDDWSALRWQAVVFNALANGTQVMHGFRPGSPAGQWRIDRQTSLRADKPLNWQPTDNWQVEAITSRGAHPKSLREAKTLLIGAGSLGSLLAEQLIRGGVSNLVIVDNDILEIGNLVRHSLPISDVHRGKAGSLASHLNSINPNVSVTAWSEGFRPDPERYRDYDLVIDTTGSDEVVYSLSDIAWDADTAICTVSIGYKAKRLYFYGHRGSQFPLMRCLDFIEPLAIEDYGNTRMEDVPREGLGCFHPVFPARIDDMTLLASCAMKEIARFMEDDVLERRSTFKQLEQAGVFGGISREEYDVPVGGV